MDKNPVLAKIAFVVDENAELGKEIRYVSMSFDGETWMPPISCMATSTGGPAYWRKVFLLFGQAYERLHVDGPLSRWPRCEKLPALICSDHMNYDHWHFLAKYWFIKTRDIDSQSTSKNKAVRGRLSAVRIQQQTLARLFRAHGSRNQFPWIAVEGRLTRKSILLCHPSIEQSREWTQRKKEPSSGLFPKEFIFPTQDARRLFKEVRDRIVASERHINHEKRFSQKWMVAYGSTIQSQAPEFPLELTLREETSPTYPDVSGQETSAASGPVSFSRLLLSVGPSGERILVSGSAGSGKSTLLRMLARDILQADGCSRYFLPIIVQLSRFDPHDHKTFQDLIRDSILDLLDDAETPLDAKSVSQLEKWLASDCSKATDILYLMDGYNEIPHEYRVGPRPFDKLLKKFLRKHKGNTLLTTRGEECPDCFNATTRYCLQEPALDAVRQYLDDRLRTGPYSFLAAQILSDPDLYSLTRTPFFLDLLVQTALGLDLNTTTPPALPRNRATLLESFVKKSLDRKFKNESVQYPTPAPLYSDVISALSCVAHRILKEPSRRFLLSHLATATGCDLPSSRAIARIAVLAGLLSNINFTAANPDQIIAFSHDLFRDYFAARYIQSRVEQGPVDFRSEYLEYHRWDDPLLLFAEMCDNKDLFVVTANEIAQHDCILATQFALNGSHATPELILTLVRGLVFILHQVYHLPPDTHYENTSSEWVAQLAATLLSHLDLSQLREAQQEALIDRWLEACIESAIAMKEPAAWASLLNNSLTDGFEAYRTGRMLLHGLAYLGSHNALVQMVEIMRYIMDCLPGYRRTLEQPSWREQVSRALPYIHDHEKYFAMTRPTIDPDIDEWSVFHERCLQLLRHWQRPLSPDDLLGVICKERNDVIKAALLNTINRAHFSERHIAGLVSLLDVTKLDECEAIVLAIGRIGGPRATDAILDIGEHFIHTPGGADRHAIRILTSFEPETTEPGWDEGMWHILHIFLRALANSQLTREAQIRLEALVSIFCGEEISETPRRRCYEKEWNGKRAWNHMLARVMLKERYVEGLAKLVDLDSVDDELIHVLKGIVNSTLVTRRAAGLALGRICCLQDPDKTLGEVARFLARLADEGNNLRLFMPEYSLRPSPPDLGDWDWLARYGLVFFADVMKAVEALGRDSDKTSCSLIAGKEHYPPMLRLLCTKCIAGDMAKPPDGLVESVLYNISYSGVVPVLDIQANLAWLEGGCQGTRPQIIPRKDDSFPMKEKAKMIACLDDWESVSILCNVQKWPRMAEEFMDLPACNAVIMGLLERRERRYLEDLGSWPMGLRSIPENYKPDGFEKVVEILA